MQLSTLVNLDNREVNHDNLLAKVQKQLASTPGKVKVKKPRVKRTKEIGETMGNFRNIKNLIMSEA